MTSFDLPLESASQPAVPAHREEDVWYTTAPAAYDYDTVLMTVEEFELPRWGALYPRVDTWRKVIMRQDPYRVAYQTARYGSGWHAAQQIDPRVQHAEWKALAEQEAASQAEWRAWIAGASSSAELRTREWQVPPVHQREWRNRLQELELAEATQAALKEAQAAEAEFRAWVEEMGGDASGPTVWLLSMRKPSDLSSWVQEGSVEVEVRAEGLWFRHHGGGFDRDWNSFWGLARHGCWLPVPAGHPVPSAEVIKRVAGEALLLWHDGRPFWVPAWMKHSCAVSGKGLSFYDEDGALVPKRGELHRTLAAQLHGLLYGQPAPAGAPALWGKPL